MDIFEKLYDEHENANIRFVGFTTDRVRYDFGVVFTKMFFGKPLIICMQTGRSTLLDSEDLKNLDHLQEVFRLEFRQDAEDLVSFFEETIPRVTFDEQYD